MRCKKTVMLLLGSSLLLSGCSRCPVSPQLESPTLSMLGGNMQERMELLLAPATTSETTQPNAKPIAPNALDSNHM